MNVVKESLKAILIFCILCNITGCSLLTCDFGFVSECGEGEIYPAYANKSGTAVKIVASAESYPRYEKSIVNNDTLHNNYYYYYEGSYHYEEWNILYPILSNNPIEVEIELHFLDEPQKCLIFKGPVKNDGIDMRSRTSYKKGNPFGGGPLLDMEYVYTITPEHKAMAKEECKGGDYDSL